MSMIMFRDRFDGRSRTTVGLVELGPPYEYSEWRDLIFSFTE